MKLQTINPPRKYTVGSGPPVTISDCAHISLQPDEQVTFKTEAGGEYDVARKNWGFYATPSVNSRLPGFGLSTALVKNQSGNVFVMLVEKGGEDAFEQYLQEETLHVIGWLSDPETLNTIEAACSDDKTA